MALANKNQGLGNEDLPCVAASYVLVELGVPTYPAA